MTALALKIDFAGLRRKIASAQTYKVKGKVVELTGLVVKAVVPNVRVGELCLIDTHRHTKPIKAEVVGFKDNTVLLMPLGELEGIGPGNDVLPMGNCLVVPVGVELLGRVLDGLGEPMDLDTKGPLKAKKFYPVHAAPPDPLTRRR
ncbi:MAG: type III secretion cytoplasmic ATPase SctN, partial [uncultured bacterium]